MYCPKCKSKLFPIDSKYIKKYGVCSYCATYTKDKYVNEPKTKETN